MRSVSVKLAVAVLLLGGPLLRPCDGQVTLAWNLSPSPAVAGYYLCWGTSSGVYTATNSFPSGQSSGVISNLIPNQVYYFAVQSFASNGAVSPFSNEASFTNAPPAAPTTTLTPPSVTWTAPPPIVYGTALGVNQLNAAANMPGNFAYYPGNGAVLNAGLNTLTVIFTPADTVDYSSVTNTTSLTVLPAPLTVTAANASCVYGTAAPEFTGAMEGLTNGDSITVTYSCGATSSSPAGTYAIVPNLADPNNRLPNYTLSLASGALTVLPATPTMIWTNPAAIVYGAPLTSNQLNATANIAGSFAYWPSNGTVLDVGTNALSVLFTPADMVDYTSVTNTASLIVSPAPLTVTASSINCFYGEAALVFLGAITGVTNGDNIMATYSCSATNGSPAGTYAIVPSLLDPNNRQTNYTVTFVNGALTVGQATPAITWTNPASISYGTALTSNQLNATASVPGSFAYDLTNGAVLDTGSNTLSVTFTPADTVDYSSITASVNLFVSPAPLTVTASNASRVYGMANPLFLGAMTGLTNGDNITATYDCSATAVSPAGTYAIVPSLLDPNNLQTNYTITVVNGTLTVGQATPTITWTNPASISYGTALTSNQLNATASAPGSFAYDLTNGAVLDTGTNTLSVTFTPADTVDYSSITASVNLFVSAAPLTVTASNAGRVYGLANPLFLGAMTGLTNDDNITAAYGCSATNGSPAGIYAIVPSLLDPNNRQTNYTVILVNGALTVGQATPAITWTNPASIIYGTALTSNQLNATASVPGSFAYDLTNGAVLDTGTNTLSVNFTPADTVDYSSITASVNLFVSPAPLTVTASNAGRVYGLANPLFLGAMTGLTNDDNITAAYGCSATNGSPAGTYAIVPSLLDPNNRQTNYTVTLVNGALTVGQATPAITWTNPAPVIYGTALTSNQLNATASVPGSFAYYPTNGTVFNAGTNTLSVTFAPADAADYSSVTNTASLVVCPAPLTVVASNASRPYGTANPTFAGVVMGLTNGDNLTAAYRCRARDRSPVGTYPIEPSLVDPNKRLANYQASFVNGTLTVGRTTPIITWTNPAPIIYGAALNSSQLNATASVLGSFSYCPPNGAALNAGTHALSLVFAPADTVDYNSMTNTVSLVVSPAPLSVTASNASRPYGAANPVFTGQILGLTNGDKITATFRCRATTASPVGVYSIIPLLNDPQGRLLNYHVGVSGGSLTVVAAPSTAPPIPTLSAGLLPTGPGIIGSSPVINSSANFWGIPPSMTITVSNGDPSVTIAGTLGATMVVQGNNDLVSPGSWQLLTNVVMSQAAPVRPSQAAAVAQNILSQAFVPASQSVLLRRNGDAPAQFFRVVMPYDYAILGSMVLKGKGYTPRLIVVNMPGILCDDACYVNEVSSFIHYDWADSALQLEASGATIRQIADTLAESLHLDWTSASEFTFSNGLCQIWATVVQTEPPSSDPIAGQNPPSEPMAIDY
jgi:hypothetical protein